MSPSNRVDPVHTPLSSADRDALITTYLRHTVEKRDDDFWAWEVVGDLARGADPIAAWDLVVALLRQSPDEYLSYVAAGPLEDMVIRHAPVLIEWIEGEAQRDARFRFALGCIWLQEGDHTPELERRIVAASGGEIHPLPGPSLERLSRPDT